MLTSPTKAYEIVTSVLGYSWLDCESFYELRFHHVWDIVEYRVLLPPAFPILLFAPNLLNIFRTGVYKGKFDFLAVLLVNSFSIQWIISVTLFGYNYLIVLHWWDVLMFSNSMNLILWVRGVSNFPSCDLKTDTGTVSNLGQLTSVKFWLTYVILFVSDNHWK